MKNLKYNIYINQLALNELDPEIDIFEAAIIDYLYYLCGSLNEKIDDKRIRNESGVWTWVDFGTMLEQMPILHFKSRGSITPRIKTLEKYGYISTLSKRINGHISLFIKMNGKVDSLFIKMNRPVQLGEQEIEKPVHLAAPIMYTSNTYNDTRNLILENFNKFWAIYPRKVAKSNAEKAWFKIKPELFDTIIADVVKRTQEDKQWQQVEFIPHAATYLNAARWTDEIIPASPPGGKLAAGNNYTKGKFEGFKGKEFGKGV